MARIIALVFASVLVTVGGASASIATHSSRQAIGQRHGGWMDAHANPKHPWLYAAGYNNNVVDIYDLALFTAPKIGQITAGLNNPGGITLDALGTLYVANQSGGTVTIYPAGATSPSLTLSQGLTEPVDSAIDTNGDVYVSNRAATPSIVVYPQGQVIPSRTITSSLISIPTAVIFDAARNLYFADNNTGVSVIAFGSQQLLSLGLQDDLPASGLALDPLNGNLFVTGPGKTQVYAPGDVNPIRHLDISPDYLSIGVIARHEFIFGGAANNQVYVWQHNRDRLYALLNTGAQYIVGTAFKPAGVP